MALAVGLCVTSGACGSDSTGSSSEALVATRSLFVVPSSLDALSDKAFFDHPFPSDLRKDAAGAIVFEGFPNPQTLPLLTQYVKDTDGLLKGFSPAAAVALRFDGAIDPGSLPADPPATIAADSSVQIVDVDPASPEHGQRHLAQLHYRAEEGVYWPSNTLAVMPMLGRPLRPSTRYAVVVTNKLRNAVGGPVGTSPDLEEVLDRKPVTEHTRAVHDLFAPAIRELAAAGIATADIVHLTVFTTNDPTEETFAAMDDVVANVPAPAATPADWTKTDESADVVVYEGKYGPSPNYQAGNIPFTRSGDGGGFVFENGKPKLQDTFVLRFALSVPNAQKCPPPAAGYPVVLYAHGTGGDYRSFIYDGTARAAGQKCLASMGIDQIFHGTRPGAPPLGDPSAETIIQLRFFNLENILAARTSNRQSAIDVVQQARLFTQTHLVVPAATSVTGQDVSFDGTKVMFFGHSQGGLNGPLFLAGSDLARGGVLSGAGCDLALNLLEKTKPVNVAATFRLLVGLADSDVATELNIFHPVMTLVQTLVDAADPLNYGSFISRAPRAGRAAKSIFQTEGVAADGTGDSYAPPHGIEALSVAIGLPRQLPGVRAVVEGGWAGLTDVSIPAEGSTGNIADGRASGVLAQFVPTGGHDGHFVVFDDPKARGQAATFLANLVTDAKGRVPAP
ncbi:MAG: putative extracellular enzyme of alpha/beta hydrolase superfamily [Labilithrix sp.]|nr:putative extracellular enzyme of alpha/beta hydrolase superfamily [Labilithrix sp.]